MLLREGRQELNNHNKKKKSEDPYTTNYGPPAGVNQPKKNRIVKKKKDADMPSFDLGIPSTWASPATQVSTLC